MAPLGVRRKDLGKIFGAEVLAQEAIEAGWLKPFIDERSFQVFEATAVAKAFARLVSEGRPKPAGK